MTDSPSPGAPGQSPPNAQLAALERDVALANREFSESLRDASDAGLQAAARIRGAVRPVLIGAAVFGGAVLVLQLVRRTRSRRSVWATLPKARRPLWAELARSAAHAVAMAGARRVARLLLVRRGDVPKGPVEVAGGP